MSFWQSRLGGSVQNRHINSRTSRFRTSRNDEGIMKPIVHISHADTIGESPAEFTDKSVELIRALLAEAFDSFDIKGLLQGESVLIKPNFVRPDYKFNPAVSTDPRMIIALGELLCDYGAARIAILDNPGVGLTFRDALDSIPGRERWDKLGLEICFMEDYPAAEEPLPHSTLFRRMKIPSVMNEFTRLINLPKLKIHMHVGASLGIKNLYGLLLDEQRMTFHRQDVNIKLIEILRRFTPDLTIIDGIWTLEGQAPICGDPISDFNTIIVGNNPVAADAVGSEIMGIAPAELATTRLAHAAGMGPMSLEEIDLRGTPLASVKRYFKRPVVSSMGAYPNCVVYELGACVGCMSSLRHALDRLHYGGDLDKIQTNTFITGIPGSFYEAMVSWEGDMWLIGDCVMSAYKDGPHIFRACGCPPHFIKVKEELMERYLNKK